jgi:hypothetical protein
MKRLPNLTLCFFDSGVVTEFSAGLSQRSQEAARSIIVAGRTPKRLHVWKQAPESVAKGHGFTVREKMRALRQGMASAMPLDSNK